MSAYQHTEFDLAGSLVLIIGPMVATAALFVLLPLMFSVVRPAVEINEQPGVIFIMPKTQKTPDVKRPQEETTPKDVQRQQQPEKVKETLNIELLNEGPGGNPSGTMQINPLEKESVINTGELFTAPKTLDPRVFTLNEVDKKPRVLRQVAPQYPYPAKRNNIEGRVALRFIVDSNGNVVDPEVTESEPYGVFNDAALEAVMKYKFQPAEKGGEPVDCIVIAPMVFQLR